MHFTILLDCIPVWVGNELVTANMSHFINEYSLTRSIVLWRDGKPRGSRTMYYSINGDVKRVKDWAQFYNVDSKLLCNTMCRKGLPLGEALNLYGVDTDGLIIKTV